MPPQMISRTAVPREIHFSLFTWLGGWPVDGLADRGICVLLREELCKIFLLECKEANDLFPYSSQKLKQLHNYIKIHNW